MTSPSGSSSADIERSGHAERQPDYISGYRPKPTMLRADHLIAFDLSHLVMLVESNLLQKDSGASILALLLENGQQEAYAERLIAGAGKQSGESLIATRLGHDAAKNVQLARSSTETNAVLFRLATRAQLLELMEAIYQLREALIRFADRHYKDVVVIRTSSQPAEMTTLGHWALMIDSALTRDSERVVALYNRMNRSPAGACAIAGCDLPVNRLRMSELLGFDGLVENTYDALQSPDLALEYAAQLMILSQSIARFADDLMVFASPEQGEIKLPHWFSAFGDVAHHGRMPIGLQDLRGLAARSMGVMNSAATSERGPTGVALFERVANELSMHELATDIIERLPVIARVLDEAVAQNHETDASVSALGSAADDYIAQRETLGGAGPEMMQAGLRSAHSRIRLGRSRLADRHRALDGAEQRRIEAAKALLL